MVISEWLTNYYNSICNPHLAYVISRGKAERQIVSRTAFDLNHWTTKQLLQIFDVQFEYSWPNENLSLADLIVHYADEPISPTTHIEAKFCHSFQVYDPNQVQTQERGADYLEAVEKLSESGNDDFPTEKIFLQFVGHIVSNDDLPPSFPYHGSHQTALNFANGNHEELLNLAINNIAQFFIGDNNRFIQCKTFLGNADGVPIELVTFIVLI